MASHLREDMCTMTCFNFITYLSMLYLFYCMPYSNTLFKVEIEPLDIIRANIDTFIKGIV